MTDSENDLTNVFNFHQNQNTTVSAKGPNTNISFMSFRNPMTSTMYMPRNFERQRYAESVCEQRSMYHRRETSPMSMISARDVRPWNFQSYYPGGSHRSTYHGRSGSPMSIRSIDSTASMSAADIALAFKTANFNTHDLQVINNAYKFMKQRFRRRVEKRRYHKMYRRGNRRRSGYDSGELGSDSSISSDDCRSTKTSTYRDHMSNFTDLRNHMKESDMLKEHTDYIKQNSLKNMFPGHSGSVNNNTHNNVSHSTHSNKTTSQLNYCTQKDRFRNGFLLPSQRFNKSVVSNTIPENEKYKHIQNNTMQNVRNYHHQRPNNVNYNNESENEEIFSETVKENFNGNKTQQKRSLDEDEMNLPNKKRTKISSPIKNAINKVPINKKNTNNNVNNFEFAKPVLPARKSKSKMQEKLIAKSSQPLTEFVETNAKKPNSNIDMINKAVVEDKAKDKPINDMAKDIASCKQPLVQETAKPAASKPDQIENADNTDVSMRPSFIKRKLFTQKLDMAEKANLSSDGMNSPHNVHSAMSKEKNKARKLVTTQSCLNRDVDDDNNLLDLIHKIVPPDRINATNQSNINSKRLSNKNDDDKWDITSVISMCVDDDVSDTFTDEEIFKPDDKVNKKDFYKRDKKEKCDIATNKSAVCKDPLIIQDCEVVVQRISDTFKRPTNIAKTSFKPDGVSNIRAQNCVKSFWDTDFESDMESSVPLPKKTPNLNQRQVNATLQPTKQDIKNQPKLPIIESASQLTNHTKAVNNTLNITADNVPKFNVSTLSIRSHRTSKVKKCLNDTCTTDTTTNQNSRSKSLTDIVKAMTSSEKVNSGEKSNSKAGSKSIKQNQQQANKLNASKPQRSASQTRKESSKITKTVDKLESTKKPKSEVQSKTAKSNLKLKNESLKANGKSKADVDSLAETHNSNSKSKTVNKPSDQSKTKSNNNTRNTNKSIVTPVENEISTKRNRPLRSCRTPSQSRSIEVSDSLLLSSENNLSRNLRSRTINISSSIENITFHFKPRPKADVNKNITNLNPRKSDVSFSLGDQNTPKKRLARTKADFMKGKRKI